MSPRYRYRPLALADLIGPYPAWSPDDASLPRHVHPSRVPNVLTGIVLLACTLGFFGLVFWAYTALLAEPGARWADLADGQVRLDMAAFAAVFMFCLVSCLHLILFADHRLDLTRESVSYRSRRLWFSQNWAEPVAAYRGIALRYAPLYTAVLMVHPNDDRTVVLKWWHGDGGEEAREYAREWRLKLGLSEAA